MGIWMCVCRCVCVCMWACVYMERALKFKAITFLKTEMTLFFLSSKIPTGDIDFRTNRLHYRIVDKHSKAQQILPLTLCNASHICNWASGDFPVFQETSPLLYVGVPEMYLPISSLHQRTHSIPRSCIRGLRRGTWMNLLFKASPSWTRWQFFSIPRSPQVISIRSLWPQTREWRL